MSSEPICIFDDDAELLELCTFILQKKGYAVHAFENCADIVDKVSSVQPKAILMDNWIPDIGGVKATQLLKSNAATKHIPIIFFSANNDVPALAASAGADSFITKPFNISELEEIVSRLTRSASTII